MLNYLFEIVGEDSELCGELFFVQAVDREEADELLKVWFADEEVECIGEYTDEDAEILGYDTY